MRTATEIEIISNKSEMPFKDIPAGSFFNFEGKVYVKTEVLVLNTKSISCIRISTGTSILLSPDSLIYYKVYKSATLTLKE